MFVRHLADYLSATFNPPRHTWQRKRIVAAVVFSRNNDHHLGDGWKRVPSSPGQGITTIGCIQDQKMAPSYCKFKRSYL